MTTTALEQIAEDSLLFLLLFDDEAVKIASRITADVFVTRSYRPIAQLALQHIAAYNTTPKQHIYELLPRKEQQVYGLMIDKIKLLAEGFQPQFVINQIDTFLEVSSYHRVLADACDSLHKGKLDEVREHISKIVNFRPTTGGLQTISLCDLVAMEFPELTWIVHNYVPAGNLTLLCGEPKIGKSYLVMEIAIAFALGSGTVLDQPVIRGEVCYLALEDPQRRAKDRALKLLAGRQAPATLRFAFHAPSLDQGLIGALEADRAAHPNTSLYIVDTLGKVQGSQGKSEGIYQYDTRNVGKLADFCHDTGVAIVVPHHTNKGDGDLLQRVSGSTGIAGQADMVLMLTRETDLKARLQSIGKEGNGWDKLLQFDDESKRYVVMGDYEKPERSGDTASAILKEMQSGTTDVIEIADALGKTVKAVDSALHRLEAKGKVKLVGKGFWELV